MSRPCVACCRRDLQNFLLTVHSESDKITVDPTCCYQLYRNLMDTPGGYFREYCLVPASDRYCGFIDPVAVFRFSLLRCDASARNHRIRLDQSMMIWRGISREVKPHLGESVTHFRLRSRRNHGPRTKSMQVQRHLAQHRNRLRVHLLQPAHVPAVIALRQLVQLESKYRTQYESTHSYESAEQFDTLAECIREARLDEKLPVTVRHPSHEYVISQDLLMDVHSLLSRCCIWTPPNTQRDPFVHTLNKLLPQRCQTRRLYIMVERFMKGNATYRSEIIRWFLCSLLGGYRHVSPEFRPPTTHHRLLLYEIYMNRDSCLLELARKCPMLLAFSLREYLVVLIDDDPVMRLHLNLLFDVDKFSERVLDTMNRLRQLVYQLIDAGTLDRDQPKEAPELLQQMQHFSEESHRGILKLAYKRSRKPLLDDFHNLAAHVPGVRVSLKSDHEQAMLTLLNHIDPSTCNPFNEMVELMEAFQLPRGALRRVRLFHQAYSTYLCNKKILKQQLHELATFFPYTYSVFFAYAQMWKSVHWIHCYSLPHHYRENQLRAIQERFRLDGIDQGKISEHVLPGDVADLWLCRGCRTIYSILVAFPPRPCEEHRLDWCPRHNRMYTYGYQCVIFDPLDRDRVFCSNEHALFDVARPYEPSAVVRVKDGGVLRANVAREQLVRVSLMGLMAVVERSVIFLCPQKGCGMPMVLNADKCAYTERGYACAACSHRLKVAESNDEQSEPLSLIPEELRCTMCDKLITNPLYAFMYPMNIILCSRHHRPFERISVALERHGRFDSQKQVIACLQQVYSDIRKEIDQRYASWNKFQLQRSRQVTRSKHSH